ncbi:MAG: radical SAM family heme chaperone HemW [Candidatus Magnetoovum sp. WYHC-5]|nr:radical SAM family heme chaperone HemW [Candidatus Magnetoovum sp. WYHC-5]
MAEFLYIHIPFCLSKCPYCDFYSIKYNETIAAGYLTAIKKELALRKEELQPLKTIYIGGGTPTILSHGVLLSLLEYINKHFHITNNAEITVESNPCTINDKYLFSLKEGGVNRLTIGVQSLIDSELSALGRRHNAKAAKNSIIAAIKYFTNVAVDLIYAIPGQTLDTWQHTLNTILDYTPVHISTYELTLEDETPMGVDAAKGKFKLPDEDTIIKMYKMALHLLKSKGYLHYEVSNHSLLYFKSRHNHNYWLRGEYVGIGASAHSFINGTRFSNIKNVALYINKINSAKLPIEASHTLSPMDILQEQIFLGLRTCEGIRYQLLTGMDTLVNKLISEDLLTVTKNNNLRLTDNGILLSNQIIVEIFQNLPKY